MKNLYLVIMAGGSGTRFWPKSTSKRPKQLLGFGRVEDGTLLTQTLDRFNGVVPQDQRMIVTTKLLSDACAQQAPKAQILAEPVGRNTAPCVYWAARAVAARDPKGIMLVMPADHYMAKPDAFRETVSQAADWAAKHDDLVTLGVKPTRPETGYGYLKIGKSQGVCSTVDAFVEKPQLARAEEFLRAGNYLWNGGMFVWRAEVVLKAFDQFMPEMKKAWDAHGGDAVAAYPAMTATSIDYGIMEKAAGAASKSLNVVSFQLDCGWDDLGSWTSLESVADVLKTRHAAGVVSGGAEVVAVESKDCIIDVSGAAPGKFVALLGVEDLIVVDTGKAILVAKKDRAQDIRLVVEAVKKTRPDLA